MQPSVAKACSEWRRPLKAEVSAAALQRPQVAQWVARELQALLLDSDVSLVAQHVQGSISAAFPQTRQRCACSHIPPSLPPPHHLALALMQGAEALLGRFMSLRDLMQACCAVMQCSPQLSSCCPPLHHSASARICFLAGGWSHTDLLLPR